MCSQAWLGTVSFQWPCSVSAVASPLHSPWAAGPLCLGLQGMLELVC